MHDPSARVAIGNRGSTITKLGLGVSHLGGTREPVGPADATRVVRHALARGVRYFDAAPLYSHGEAERRLGAALATEPADDVVVSTKVGYVIGDDGHYLDFSADAVVRSLEQSLTRLDRDHVEIVFVHDPRDHDWQRVVTQTLPALRRLRAEGVVGAIGVGMTRADMLARFARETDVDVVMCAGRYGLMDQSALDDLLSSCLDKGIAVLIAGVLHNGLVADPRPGARYNYRDATADEINRAQAIGRICGRHHVTPTAASVQFALAHPAVAGLVAGAANAGQVDDYDAAVRQRLPAALWDELREAGHIPENAPTPTTETFVQIPEHG